MKVEVLYFLGSIQIGARGRGKEQGSSCLEVAQGLDRLVSCMGSKS